MGRIQDKWDQAEESRQVRQRNEVCTNRLLDALIKHHGQVKEEEPEPEPPVSLPFLHKIEVIKRAVCKQFNISKQLIESSCRKSNAVHPRQIAMYLARKHTNHSFPEIGRRFGGRDHTTIVHAFHKIGHLRSKSAELAADLELLEEAIA